MNVDSTATVHDIVYASTGTVIRSEVNTTDFPISFAVGGPGDEGWVDDCITIRVRNHYNHLCFIEQTFCCGE